MIAHICGWLVQGADEGVGRGGVTSGGARICVLRGGG